MADFTDVSGLATSDGAGNFEIVIDSASTGTQTWAVPSHSKHADCGTVTLEITLTSSDSQHTSYYSTDVSNGQFSYDFDATRTRELLRQTTVTAKYTSDYETTLTAQAQININEYSCTPISNNPNHVVFINTEPIKDITRSRLSTLDATRCLTGVESFTLGGASVSSFPWLS